MPATKATKIDVRIRVIPSKALLDAIVGARVVQPRASDLAEVLGWPLAKVVGALGHLERFGRIDHWPDPEKPGDYRMLLTEKEARRHRLTLSPKGDRWLRPHEAIALAKGPAGGAARALAESHVSNAREHGSQRSIDSRVRSIGPASTNKYDRSPTI